MNENTTHPIYTPSEMVRLELLRYQNPEGLHPIESNWRDLARKLMENVEYMQDLLAAHHKRTGYSITSCDVCKNFSHGDFKIPEAFKPKTD